MKAFGFFKKFDIIEQQRKREMNYLNQSVSLADLERRQKELSRGGFTGYYGK